MIFGIGVSCATATTPRQETSPAAMSSHCRTSYLGEALCDLSHAGTARTKTWYRCLCRFVDEYDEALARREISARNGEMQVTSRVEMLIERPTGRTHGGNG